MDSDMSDKAEVEYEELLLLARKKAFWNLYGVEEDDVRLYASDLLESEERNMVEGAIRAHQELGSRVEAFRAEGRQDQPDPDRTEDLLSSFLMVSRAARQGDQALKSLLGDPNQRPEVKRLVRTYLEEPPPPNGGGYAQRLMALEATVLDGLQRLRNAFGVWSPVSVQDRGTATAAPEMLEHDAFVHHLRLLKVRARAVRTPGDIRGLLRELDKAIALVESWLSAQVEVRDVIGRYEADVEALLEEAASIADENWRLRNQNDSLNRLLAETGRAPVRGYPTELAQIAEWCREELPGRLTLLPRALRALKAGSYEDVGLVARSLEALATSYRDARLGFEGSHESFQAFLSENRLELEKSGDPTTLGREADAYVVEYPLGLGTKRTLEWHLGKGVSRDPRHCLRIYFFWDDASRTVVVGHLPAHLDNGLT